MGGMAHDPTLLGLVDELRSLARTQLARLPPGQTLQPTALVHEAWLRLERSGRAAPSTDRRAWLGLAALTMRDLLVEEARHKASLRRGGGWARTELAGLQLASEAEPEQLLALDEALTRLARRDPAKAELVRMRFFVGLGEDECAEALGVSVRTVRRSWRYARAFLYDELAEGDGAA
jgi:RNA polymerase sigma factor (TIGR02999 family)